MNNPIPFIVNPYNEYPNVNSMQNNDIKNLENRVYNLEKELANLKAKIVKIEQENDIYTNSYKANTYNMM